MKKIFQIIAPLLLLLISVKPVKAQLQVTEYFNTISPGRHYYSTNHQSTNQAPTGPGWVSDGVVGYLNDPVPIAPGTGTWIYQFYQSSNHSYYYSTSLSQHPAGYVQQAILGVYLPSPNHVAVYEYYNDGDYYYSTSTTTPAGYVLDGLAFYYNFDGD